ncbi:hypothetical protein BJX61DRAFT_538635 [Aspergillus egyptiacus]|nr:hypothetical protein BJX61DRAFT_538635 [Aspergillus egyptiacus]
MAESKPVTLFTGRGADLPPEVLELIEEYVMGGNPDRPDFDGSVPGSLCRVNSLWHQRYNPLLYQHFTYHGTAIQTSHLLGFLRTISQSPHLATQVQELTLTTSQWHEHVTSLTPEQTRTVIDLIMDNEEKTRGFVQTPVEVQLKSGGTFNWRGAQYLRQGRIRKENEALVEEKYLAGLYRRHQPWLEEALRSVQLDPIEKDPFFDRWARVTPWFRSLPAVLILFCPNLLRLNYDSHGSATDFFSEIMDRATNTANSRGMHMAAARPLQRLEVLNIAGAVVEANQSQSLPRLLTEPWPTSMPDQYVRKQLKFDSASVYFRLPALKKLTLLNGNPSSSWNPVDAFTSRQSIEELTITGLPCHHHLHVPPTLVPRLRQLSLKLNPNEHHQQDLDKSVWPTLHSLREQLEYLDLCPSEDSSGNRYPLSLPSERDPEPFCPPLQDFPKLRHLNISPHHLAGHRCPHPPPTKLRSHLPPNLQSLGLYFSDPSSSTTKPIAQLSTELAGIVTVGAADKDGQLRSIVVEKRHAPDDFAPDDVFPLDELEKEAARHGVFFSAEGDKYLFSAGDRTRWGYLNRCHEMSLSPVRDEERMTDPARVIPVGMEVNGYRGRLSLLR